MQISRIRLSDKTSRLHPRHVFRRSCFPAAAQNLRIRLSGRPACRSGARTRMDGISAVGKDRLRAAARRCCSSAVNGTRLFIGCLAVWRSGAHACDKLECFRAGRHRAEQQPSRRGRKTAVSYCGQRPGRLTEALRFILLPGGRLPDRAFFWLMLPRDGMPLSQSAQPQNAASVFDVVDGGALGKPSSIVAKCRIGAMEDFE